MSMPHAVSSFDITTVVDQTVDQTVAKRGASLMSTWVFVLWLLDLAQPLPWPTASGGLALD